MDYSQSNMVRLDWEDLMYEIIYLDLPNNDLCQSKINNDS